MRQKLSSGRPCIPALPGTHNLLASPLTALLTSPFIITSYIIAILEVWTDLLHVHLYTPCRPHPCAHGTDSQPCTQTPPLLILPKEVANRQFSSSENLWCLYNSVEVAQKNPGGGVPKSRTPPQPPTTTPLLGSVPCIYQSTALNPRIPNI